MSLYCIIKDNLTLGPFDIDSVCEFVQSGMVLKRDEAYDVSNPGIRNNVGYFLKLNGKTVRIEHKGGLLSQLKDIGKEIIIPSKLMSSSELWKKDNKLIMLCIVGLSLSVLLIIAPILPLGLIFYAVSLYFSLIWGLFFYYLFKPDDVSLKTTILLFLICQACVFILFQVIEIQALDPLGDYASSDNWGMSLLSCVCGIGIREEVVKLLPILFILVRSSKVTSPQTAVFYGLMSGIAFGVYEGVSYQMGPNFQMIQASDIEVGYVQSFISNIARLTCLPFLHAVWCGIGSYFTAFAFIYPRFRISLGLLAVLIPAILHGLYDFTCFQSLVLLQIVIILAGVILLMAYLKNYYDLHSKLYD